MSGQLVVVRDVRKAFSSSKKATAPHSVVDGVSFSLNRGEVFALLGPNGAGKTTTVKIVIGLIARDGGSVAVCGMDPYVNPRAAQSFGAILEGNRNLYWRLTVLENLVYFGALKGMSPAAARSRGKELLDRFGLLDRADTLVQKLSRGLQQRAAITACLIHDPAVVIMDEPTLALDVEAVEDIAKLISELRDDGIGIILCSHQLPFVERLADRVAIMREGQIVLEGKTADILRGFASDTFSISLESELDPITIDKLAAAGAIVSGNVIVCHGLNDLYEAFSLIKPAAIASVQREGADLTEIFMGIVRDHGTQAISPEPTEEVA